MMNKNMVNVQPAFVILGAVIRASSGRFAAITTILAVLLFACESGRQEPSRPVGGESFVPEAGEGIVMAEAETGPLSIQEDQDEPSPRVSLEPSVVVISTMETNLDPDEPEEQVVVAKRRDDPSDRIRLLVADFDTLRNTYRVTWEGSVGASNVRTFALYNRDLIGDHSDELVAFGTNNDGQQTLDVFRRRLDGSLSGLEYYPVLSVAVDASIEIVDQNRSEAYRTMQSDGVSFPIQTFRRDQETENPLDLVQTTYYWRVEDNKYVAEEETKIPAVEIEEAQLRELYNSEAGEIEQFLSGPWFRSAGENVGGNVELAHFDPEEREVVLFRPGTQERFEWTTTYKTIYQGGPGVWMNLQNEVLDNVRKQLSITIVGVDSVYLSVEDAEYWNGRYERMTSGLQESVVRESNIQNRTDILKGLYRNENEQEILFTPPFFTFRDGSTEHRGGYSLYENGNLILELMIVKENGSMAETRQYVAEIDQIESDGKPISRLTLQPARMTIRGAVRLPGEPLVLEKVGEEEEESG